MPFFSYAPIPKKKKKKNAGNDPRKMAHSATEKMAQSDIHNYSGH